MLFGGASGINRFMAPGTPPSHDTILAEYLRIAPLSRAIIRSREIELILEEGLSGGRLIDLGHGDGTFASFLEARDLRFFVGVDLSWEELRRARGRSSARLVAAEMERLPFRPGAFDGALSNCVLEHVEDLDRAFREAARVTRPGSRILATVVTDRYEDLLFWPRLLDLPGFRYLRRAYLGFIARRFVHRRYPPVAEWLKRAREAGLAFERLRPYVGARRQALMDLFLPWVQVSRFLRVLFGRETILPDRWPASRVERMLESDREIQSPAEAANAFLVFRKV